jgi:hypothetical protein
VGHLNGGDLRPQQQQEILDRNLTVGGTSGMCICHQKMLGSTAPTPSNSTSPSLTPCGGIGSIPGRVTSAHEEQEDREAREGLYSEQ